MNYYVYVYLDPRKPGLYSYESLGVCFLYEPFYIGKGSGDRWRHHLWDIKAYEKSNPYKHRKIKTIQRKLGIGPYVVIVKYFSEGSEAYSYENSAIQEIGRVKDKSGPLTNLDDGGGINSRNKREWWTEERKKQRSLDNKGTNNPMSGKSLHEVWLGKYGKEEADRKLLEFREKHKGGKGNPKGRGAKAGIISKYGEEKGLKLWKEVIRKQTEGRLRGSDSPFYIKINKEDFHKLLLLGKGRKDICESLGITNVTLSNRMKGWYGTSSIKEIREIYNE